MTGPAHPPADDFDPTRSQAPADVYAMYAHLREHCPVGYSRAYGGHWALSRYEDVKAAASDPRTYISSVRAVVPSDPRGLRRPPLNFDAPDHTPFRRALDRTLHRKRVARLERPLARHAEQELEPLLERGSGDVAQEYGARFPAWVTVEWLNLSPGTAPVLAEHAARWVNAWRDEDAAAVNEHSEHMYRIARDLVAAREREPLPVERDPASSLLAERPNGHPLDREQIVGALRQSLVVGMVAPPILLGSICAHLAADRELQERLRSRPDLLPDAIEEFLRLYTPYRGFARTVRTEQTLHDRTIRPGEPVTLAYASANRDETVFPGADTFRMGRPNIHEHLAFGRGRHRCAGMPLARLGLLVSLRALLARTRHFEAAGETEGARMPEVGAVSVPLVLHRAPEAG
ncbi:cytochrome P450 [Lipingzhangella halophila]|uniref:Cytochrome P450 n=1 Tax=Lipingzhangella halophila TaxID=1783352 RepID=A0A7W7W3C6_9ACTN|nr:cytochrome P450 [Lipingzhangella halophila]MBB4932641.1 cytochrome P450 [Lipingzhangella halophila]